MSAAGKYRYDVEVYSPENAKSSVGSNMTTWTKVYTTKADVRFNSGNRSVVENEVFYDYSKVFILRMYVPIGDFDRIKFDGKYYRVINIDRRKEYHDIEVLAELVND